MDLVDRAAATDLNIVVFGEAGTGIRTVAELPPLRVLGAGLPRMVEEALAGICNQRGLRHPAVSKAAAKKLASHRWPGNLTELRRVLERAVVLSGTEPICASHVELFDEPGSGLTAEEREQGVRIAAALTQCRGNHSRAAQMLGIPRDKFIARQKKYGIADPTRR